MKRRLKDERLVEETLAYELMFQTKKSFVVKSDGQLLRQSRRR